MPKLQTIDGKTRHYAYTPEGKKAYERDKAAMKMSGLQPPQPPDPNPKPKPKQGNPKKMQPASKSGSLKMGGIAGKMGVTRSQPKRKNESEAQWIFRVGKESIGDSISGVMSGVSKIKKKLS